MSKGFIALFSVIIISLVLLLVASALSFSGFFARFNILDSELKAQSEGLADACIEHVRLALALDAAFSGSGEVDIDGEKCEYEVSDGEVKAWAEVSNAHTYYFAEVNLDEPKIPITSFRECTDLSPCP